MAFQWLRNRRSALARAQADARQFEAAYNETVRQLVATQEEVADLKARNRAYRDFHFAEQQRWEAQKETLSGTIVRIANSREPVSPDWSNPTEYQGA